MTDDAELLRQYADTSSESAFAELVSRHLPLVYWAALRQVNRDEQSAKDVAQSVFIDLARKAASLSRHEVLIGWLYTSTRFAASKVLRADRRRQTREGTAMFMQEISAQIAPEPDWDQFSLTLDAVMAELSLPDRNAVLLRFFEGKELKAVGKALGISEDGARMRVNRAVEKLRGLFARRGLTCTAAVLGTLISAQAVQVVPAGLVGAVSTSALSAAAGLNAGTNLATSSLKLMISTKTKIGLVLLAAGITATVLVIQQYSLQDLRTQNAELQQRVASADQKPLSAPAPSAGVSISPSELAQFERDRMSLLRLRNEVTQLRQQVARLKVAPAGAIAPQTAANPAAAPEPMDVVTNDTPTETYDHLLRYGALSFSNMNVSSILPNLPGLTGATVEAERGVMDVSSLVSFSAPIGANRSEAALLLEQALERQAGLLITHPATNHIVIRLKSP